MAVLVTIEHIERLAPGVRPGYRAAFAAGQQVLEGFAIAASPLRVAHFIAQLMHESGALTREVENLNYSARRLVQLWPWRFKPHGPLNADEGELRGGDRAGAPLRAGRPRFRNGAGRGAGARMVPGGRGRRMGQPRLQPAGRRRRP